MRQVGKNFVSKINLKAIGLGVLSGIAAGLTLVFVLAIVHLTVVGPGQTHSFLNSNNGHALILTLLSIAYITTGYVVGRIAKKDVNFNAISVGVLFIIFDLLPIPALQNDQDPLWVNVVSSLIIIPCILLGVQIARQYKPPSRSDIEAQAEKLDLHNRKYLISSLWLSFIILLPVSHFLGHGAHYWSPAYTVSIYVSISFIFASEFAAYLAKRRFIQLSIQLKPKSDGLQRANYIAVKARLKARTFRWFLVLGMLCPIISDVYHIGIAYVLLACIVILNNTFDRSYAKKATLETGYSPTSKS